MRTAKALYWVLLTCCVVIVAGRAPAVADDACSNPNALGTSRTIVVDPTEHPLLGTMQYRETLPLRDHEVVITFDDGPLPPNTGRILDILASQCVKANYFMVGRMAKTYPKWVQRVAAAGHTIGTHSMNHPFTFNRMPLERAEQEINDGIAAVKAALGGQDPAPFFRIPGLLRVKRVEDYLASQHIQVWSADFPADDWKRISDQEILHRALTRLEAHGKGILLLHDIHPGTALMLPTLLRELKARGYHIVHVVAASPDRPKTATVPEQWLMHPKREKAPETLTVSAGSVPGLPASERAQLASTPFGAMIVLPLRLQRQQPIATSGQARPALRGTVWPRSAIFKTWAHGSFPVPDRDVFTAPVLEPSSSAAEPRHYAAVIAAPAHPAVVTQAVETTGSVPERSPAAAPEAPSLWSAIISKIRQQISF